MELIATILTRCNFLLDSKQLLLDETWLQPNANQLQLESVLLQLSKNQLK
jgi:hypothetical protein